MLHLDYAPPISISRRARPRILVDTAFWTDFCEYIPKDTFHAYVWDTVIRLSNRVLYCPLVHALLYCSEWVHSTYQIIMHDSTLIPCYLPSFLFLGILIFQNIYSFLFLSLNYDYLRSFCFTKRYYILDFNFFSFYIFFRTSFLHNCG